MSGGGFLFLCFGGFGVPCQGSWGGLEGSGRRKLLTQDKGTAEREGSGWPVRRLREPHFHFRLQEAPDARMKRGDEGSWALEHWAGQSQGPERGGRDSPRLPFFVPFLPRVSGS